MTTLSSSANGAHHGVQTAQGTAIMPCCASTNTPLNNDLPSSRKPRRKKHLHAHGTPSAYYSGVLVIQSCGRPSAHGNGPTQRRSSFTTFSQWMVRIAASLSTPMSSCLLSPSEDQQSAPVRGSFSSVRVLLNGEHRTAKWWLRHVPGSLRRPRNSNHVGSNRSLYMSLG